MRVLRLPRPDYAAAAGASHALSFFQASTPMPL
eukprot:CAMPEP_0202767534 /NCGR_PEP_ID=MMETSP1388-20130828/32987_1 /ASSEMBLY_ACC=CAM_ASM_000864 /TAXON_ID=37098 /ORGANISM="Isochrysis sp, Strain CCMP1244" /LENGTH=32 /DNA_ID= /DNA_START= /DNA_END= /DNA_ORIENTATION=